MRAISGHVYMQVLDGRAHWRFTEKELPFWSDEHTTAIDITGIDPEPQLGDLYVDGRFVKDYALAHRKLDAERDAERFDPVEYKGHRFQADRDSLSMLNFQLTDLLAFPDRELEDDFVWWNVDNQAVSMRREDIVALHHLVRNRNYEIMKAARAKKDTMPAPVVAQLQEKTG